MLLCPSALRPQIILRLEKDLAVERAILCFLENTFPNRLRLRKIVHLLTQQKTRYQSISKLSFKKWQKHRKQIAVKSHNNRL